MKSVRFAPIVMTEEELIEERSCKKFKDMARDELEQYCHELNSVLYRILKGMNIRLKNDEQKELKANGIESDTITDISYSFFCEFDSREDADNELKEKNERLKDMDNRLNEFENLLEEMTIDDDADVPLLLALKEEVETIRNN